MNAIDVVVPCYRYGRYLRQCVESVLTQAVADVRVLIIDDESPDDTPQVGAALANEDERVTFRRHAKNQGHIATYNEGIAWAEARYLLLLSADDYLLPGSLQRALGVLAAQPEVRLLFGNAVAIHDSTSIEPTHVGLRRSVAGRSIVMSGREFLGLCTREGATNFVATPTAIVCTESLKRTGGYDPALPHTADYELWLRMAGCGSVCYLLSDQAVYRRHSANMSLGYVDDRILVDLEQRKAALDLFASKSKADLADVDAWHARLLRALAVDALRHASKALDRDRIELHEQILAFASAVDSGVHWTWQWRLLATRRRFGLKVSPSLLPAAALARGMARRLRG